MLLTLLGSNDGIDEPLLLEDGDDEPPLLDPPLMVLLDPPLLPPALGFDGEDALEPLMNCEGLSKNDGGCMFCESC